MGCDEAHLPVIAGTRPMSDSYSDPQQNRRNFEGNRENPRGGFRGGRGPTNRDGGGFRIRLSDNEMRAARALQEAFQLRSTVAVLGFALRTLGQMLEEGKLDDVLTTHRAQQGSRGNRNNERDQNDRRDRFESETVGRRGVKPNPFARPEKPQTSTPKPEETDSEGINELTEENIETSQNQITEQSEEINSSADKIPEVNSSQDDEKESSSNTSSE